MGKQIYTSFLKQPLNIRIAVFVTLTVVVILFTLVTLVYQLIQVDSNSIDLLTNKNEYQLASVVDPDPVEGIRIEPLNRKIIHQDGSEGHPNPQVFVLGPHLSVKGDFKITARMEGIESNGSFRLYAKPPVIYDQWRFESGSIAIEVATGTISVRIWDGTSSSSIDMRSYQFMLKNMMLISIEHKGNTFLISANGRLLGVIPDHNIFYTNELWFGAEAFNDDDWVLKTLKAEALLDGRVEIIDTPSFEAKHDDPNALRNLADAHSRKLKIGTAVAFSPLVTDNKYRNLVVKEFNMITPENDMKPQFIHPQKDIYSFDEIDALVNIALKNEMSVHGHSLVYVKSNPEWMDEIPEEDREEVMINHIETIVGHFKGKVASWDVVNEPLSHKRSPYYGGGNGLEENIWYEAMGERYIDLAFRVADKSDPGAELYLNDYGLEREGERWDALLSLIERLQARGVPIDGIGFESHVYGDGDYSDASVLKDHMETLGKLGLKVRISEIDVTGEDPKEQVNQYLIALDVCLKAPNCTGYSTWGVTDLYGSTTRSDRYPQVYGTSLLFDKDFKPKPAYSVIRERLKQKN